MTHDELVEKVERAIGFSGYQNYPRTMVHRVIAKAAISTIREALQEPTDEMSRCTLLTKNEVKLYWPELLAASPLGEPK